MTFLNFVDQIFASCFQPASDGGYYRCSLNLTNFGLPTLSTLIKLSVHKTCAPNVQQLQRLANLQSGIWNGPTARSGCWTLCARGERAGQKERSACVDLGFSV